MRNVAFSSLIVLSLCVVQGVCLADSISYSTTTPIPSTKTDWIGSLAFPKFNPTMGILESVQIDLSGTMQSTLTVTNNASSASNGRANTHFLLIGQDVGGNLNAPVDTMGPSFNYNLTPGGSLVSGLLTRNFSSSDVYTAPVVLAEFTGVGNLSLDASTFTETALFNSGGNTDASQVTFASATGTVKYSYRVPEPAALALLLLGGMLVIARRRRVLV